MPHKRNPITAERVCGLARVVKANAQVAFDDVALWYERDISHSGAERVALADSFIALDYMFGKMQWMLDGLQTYPAKMEHNLWRTRGLIFSQQGAAGARGHGHHPRGRLRHRAAQRHEGVGGHPERRGRPHLPRAPGSRPRGRPAQRRRRSTRSSTPGTSSPARTWCSTACRSWSSSRVSAYLYGRPLALIVLGAFFVRTNAERGVYCAAGAEVLPVSMSMPWASTEASMAPM